MHNQLYHWKFRNKLWFKVQNQPYRRECRINFMILSAESVILKVQSCACATRLRSVIYHIWAVTWDFQQCGQRFFFSSRAEILPHSQWNLGDFFPNFEERNPNLNFLTFFLKIGIFIQWPLTSYMLTIYIHCILFLLQFDGKSMCHC